MFFVFFFFVFCFFLFGMLVSSFKKLVFCVCVCVFSLPKNVFFFLSAGEEQEVSEKRG